MLRNYLTIAIRHLNRQKGYSFINVMSLALGIACCLLILLYIRDELSYDRYYDRADRIYRVTAEERQGGEVVRTADVLVPTVWYMREDLPEIEDMVRLVPPGNTWMVKYGDKGFYERSFYLADTTVFDVFDVPLLTGNPKTALAGNDKIVLSESIARKYFGNEDPMGKILDAEGTFHLEVTGIMPDLPSNTHLGFDMLASFKIQEAYSYRKVNEWGWRTAHSYVVLREGSDPAELEAKLPAFVKKHLGNRYESGDASLTYRLQPVTDIHLHSRLERELTPNGDIRYIYLFAAIAVFILVIACINFMNLATARFAGRAREIGLRKVFGAVRTQMARQFLVESLLMSALAVCLALLLAAVCLPWFSLLTGKTLVVDTGTTLFALGAVVVIGVVVGCISGSYPAFYLSGLMPVETLKGTLASGSGTAGLRRILVVSQFVISIALIICTGIVYNQLDFIRKRNMGLNTERVVAVPLTFDPVQETARIFKQRVKESPYITNATATFMLPGHKNAVIPITLQRPGEGEHAKIDMNQAWTDEDFVETLGIEMVTGRYFDPTFVSDWGWESAGGGAVLNEAAVARLGYDSPDEALGKEVNWVRELRQGWEEEGMQLRRIVGVVKDFHYASLHQPIGPLILFADYQGGHIVIKTAPDFLSEGLVSIEEIWHETNPDFAFEYFFVDDNFARLYETERRFGQVFVSFAALAVLIACLGLFGLASFTAERRTKEIGVRKVLGASTPKLFGLLSDEFVRLVIVANVFAWPAAYFVMNNWLDNFAYRVEPGWTIFILASVITMAIALLTVGFQAVRAATANPVESLRSE